VSYDDRLQLRYKTFVTTDQAIKNIKVLSAEDYRQKGGFDEFNDTDWMGEITQNAYSMAHQLSFAQRLKSFYYEVRGNYRSGENTLLNTGYDQKSIRLNLNQSLLLGKIKWNAQFSALGQKADPGTSSAYRYALNRNPTAPVFDDSNTTNAGYAESIFFDYYNPVSLVFL